MEVSPTIRRNVARKSTSLRSLKVSEQNISDGLHSQRLEVCSDTYINNNPIFPGISSQRLNDVADRSLRSHVHKKNKQIVNCSKDEKEASDHNLSQDGSISHLASNHSHIPEIICSVSITPDEFSRCYPVDIVDVFFFEAEQILLSKKCCQVVGKETAASPQNPKSCEALVAGNCQEKISELAEKSGQKEFNEGSHIEAVKKNDMQNIKTLKGTEGLYRDVKSTNKKHLVEVAEFDVQQSLKEDILLDQAQQIVSPRRRSLSRKCKKKPVLNLSREKKPTEQRSSSGKADKEPYSKNDLDLADTQVPDSLYTKNIELKPFETSKKGKNNDNAVEEQKKKERKTGRKLIMKNNSNSKLASLKHQSSTEDLESLKSDKDSQDKPCSEADSNTNFVVNKNSRVDYNKNFEADNNDSEIDSNSKEGKNISYATVFNRSSIEAVPKNKIKIGGAKKNRKKNAGNINVSIDNNKSKDALSDSHLNKPLKLKGSKSKMGITSVENRIKNATSKVSSSSFNECETKPSYSDDTIKIIDVDGNNSVPLSTEIIPQSIPVLNGNVASDSKSSKQSCSDESIVANNKKSKDKPISSITRESGPIAGTVRAAGPITNKYKVSAPSLPLSPLEPNVNLGSHKDVTDISKKELQEVQEFIYKTPLNNLYDSPERSSYSRRPRSDSYREQRSSYSRRPRSDSYREPRSSYSRRPRSDSYREPRSSQKRKSSHHYQPYKDREHKNYPGCELPSEHDFHQEHQKVNHLCESRLRGEGYRDKCDHPNDDMKDVTGRSDYYSKKKPDDVSIEVKRPRDYSKTKALLQQPPGHHFSNYSQCENAEYPTYTVLDYGHKKVGGAFPADASGSGRVNKSFFRKKHWNNENYVRDSVDGPMSFSNTHLKKRKRSSEKWKSPHLRDDNGGLLSYNRENFKRRKVSWDRKDKEDLMKSHRRLEEERQNRGRGQPARSRGRNNPSTSERRNLQ